MSNETPKIPQPRGGRPWKDVRAEAEQMRPGLKVKSEANSTAAMIFGLVFVVCACVCMVMLTVAFGIYLFG